MEEKIKALETQRAAKITEMQKLNQQAIEGSRDLTEAEQTAYDAIKGEVETIDKNVRRYKEAEQIRARAAEPLDKAIGDKTNGSEGGGLVDGEVRAPEFLSQMKAAGLMFGQGFHEKAKKSSKSDFGCFVVCLLKGGNNPYYAAMHAWQQFGNDAVAKALATGTPGDGGYLVPTEFSQEFIELLRPAAVVRAAGPRTMNFPGGFGTIQLPAAATGVTAGWVGENQPLGYGQMTFAPVTLTPKKLAALTAVSNELIRRSMPDVDTIVRDDLVQSVATVESATMITATAATAGHPIGLRGVATDASHTTPSTGVTLANVTTDLDALSLILKNDNVRFTRPAWFFAPKIETYLMSLRDGNGNFAFRPEMLTGRLLRYPYFATTSIPTNESTDQTVVYLADMDDMVLAQELAVVVDVSQEAAYSTTGLAADMVSSFQSDQTVVRIIETVDFAARRPSAALLTAVDWGNPQV